MDRQDLVMRLSDFMENETRSCSMDFGGITPIYVYRIIDKQLLDDVSRLAQKSDKLRMNYNFHQSLEDKCHRFLNAVEPGTVVPYE